MTRARFVARALAPAMGLVAVPAAAHTGTGLAGGFVSGFAHPLSGPDHLLAMVSVGLWGAFLGRPLVYALPVVFPMMMVAGAVVGMAGIAIPSTEIGIKLSVMVLGGCIALALRAPVWIAASIVAVFAICHGYAHGRELPSAADPMGYSVGFVLATGLLHVAGIALGSLEARRGGTPAIRLAGGAIAAIGGVFLLGAVMR
ncbi:HupE/UreJ family protein [Sphingomonas asaccharolytica]|uniref:HupE/UreJ family protein n=1 Tax=Sphingomonas asaccharolytica TaxID=40681 RepID=UPI000836064A|nr:HupE/UreJ family protein [Sphingomonas asaccharolytica]